MNTPENLVKKTPAKDKLKKRHIGLGLYLMVMAFFLLLLLIQIWPTVTSDKTVTTDNIHLLWLSLTLGSDLRLILLVLIAGMLGSYVHATTSFVTYVGNRSMVDSWTWWYILRPFIGMILALIFYFVLRGGFLSTGAETTDISPYGIAAVSGLVGMFSKQATDKLREVFDTLFKTAKGDDLRKDKLDNKVPVTDKIIPLNKMTYISLNNGDNSNLKLGQIIDKLGGIVTRMPVLNQDDHILYIIHQSVLYKYIAESTLSAARPRDFNVNDVTLADFLQHDNITELVTKSLAFVNASATIADAKLKMEEIQNCQDVFITKNGNQNESVLGWLTNIDITKNIS